jgi:hypothetical protein
MISLDSRIEVVTISIKKLSWERWDGKYTFIGDHERVLESLQSLIPIIDSLIVWLVKARL